MRDEKDQIADDLDFSDIVLIKPNTSNGKKRWAFVQYVSYWEFVANLAIVQEYPGFNVL